MTTPRLFHIVDGPLDGDSVSDCGEQLCLGPHRWHRDIATQRYIYQGLAITSAAVDSDEAEALSWPAAEPSASSQSEPTARLLEQTQSRQAPHTQPCNPPSYQPVPKIFNWIGSFLLWCVFLLIVLTAFRAPVIGLGILVTGLLLRWIWKAALQRIAHRDSQQRSNRGCQRSQSR